MIWFLWGRVGVNIKGRRRNGDMHVSMGGDEGQILRIEKRGERGDTVSRGEFTYWGWKGENRDMVSWGGGNLLGGGQRKKQGMGEMVSWGRGGRKNKYFLHDFRK